MISSQDKCKYLHILSKLNAYHANIFTLQELSYHLEVSKRKLIDFKKGKVIDFWLLIQYGAIISKKVDFLIDET